VITFLCSNGLVDPQTSASKPQLRASDAERDRVASVLNDALAEGRITAQEHGDRLERIYAAKTQAELVPVIEDLPAPGGQTPTAVSRPEGRAARIIAVFGGAMRRGTWRVPPETTIVTVFGGAVLDLRDAVLPGQEFSIRAVSVFGGVQIIVPPHMQVIDSGLAVFGGRDVPGDTDESGRPDAPVLRLAGACVFGGISVERKPSDPRGWPGSARD
jgi:Domain of unknown function (DUF1707)/Cell wall-active antibiotics response 4TMS YvqF